jgi:copper resistance protein B
MRHTTFAACTAVGLMVGGSAIAQSTHHTAGAGGGTLTMNMGGDHDSAPVYYFIRANRLDYGASQAGARGSWDIDARIGTDDHRLVLKTEGEYVRGKGENAEVQLLYSTPITDFFDFQIGARQLFVPVGRSYFAMGVQGVLPWFIDTEATIFISNKGQPSARIKAEIDLPWTASIYSRPSIELNAYGSDDRQVGTYAGLGTVKLALQTRYQVTRQLAPYVEIGWEKAFGQTANAARHDGERTDNAYAVVGIRLLY